ncbi:hypothetical protein HF086_005331 [Spodoptera exigua]|uniref:DH domain-containing protein n=1 Tax=Spodoptera exigua TaxID=7107 RepID=A0A922N164_SPOEX|nr:hypothetical protein HF086_005331 [Spodoptera exigua]
MFAEGMVRGAGVSAAQAARMFPRVDELWALHAALLARLRARQAAAPAVASVADILCDTFAPPNHHKLKAAYAQRLTKYPLLLEPLLKTAGDDLTERDLLQRALCGVKEILVDVDNQVAAKEREDRKLEIYHRIDAKSFANFRGRKFKKSDILQGNRSLNVSEYFPIIGSLNPFLLNDYIRRKEIAITQTNALRFFVVSLVKLLVREKAGAEGRGLYLICSGPTEPEMFELRVHRPKDIQTWIQAIRAVVQSCPEEVEESEVGATAPSAEERQRQLDARHENIRLITEALRAKDREHATLLEEKMALQMKLVGITDETWLTLPHTGSSTAFPGLVFPDYVRLAAPSADKYALWQDVCKVVMDALEASSAPWQSGGALGRSTSSAGERHSVALEAQVSAWRWQGGGGARTPDWSDAQLEELRHAQARLTRDRAAFDAQRAADHAALNAGLVCVCIGHLGWIAFFTLVMQECGLKSSEERLVQWTVLLNEILDTSEAIACELQMVKQQLPLKLASGKSQQPPPGYHRLHESPSENKHVSQTARQVPRPIARHGCIDRVSPRSGVRRRGDFLLTSTTRRAPYALLRLSPLIRPSEHF